MKINLHKLTAQVGRARQAPELVGPHLKFKANRIPYALDGQGRSWPPRRIFLGVNSVCGERCVMCDFGQKATERMFYLNLRPTRKALELPLERLYKLIDEVKSFRPVLEAHTVEPTLYRDLPALAAYATRNGLPFRVFTSGSRLAHMAEDLVKANVDQIYVSIDGPPPLHDQIRGVKGSFARAIEGIQLVNEACQRYPDKGTKVRINATISNYNYEHLVDLVEAVQEVNPFCIMFMHLNFVTPEMVAQHNPLYGHICQATPLGIGGTEPGKIDAAILYSQIQQLQQRFPQHRILVQPDVTSLAELQMYYHEPETFIRQKKCYMPWRTALVMPNGGVIVRNRCYHVVFGNIFEQPFMDIWNNQAYRDFRVALKEAGTFPACARCYGAFEA